MYNFKTHLLIEYKKIIAYHYTHAPEFKAFQRFSHFGSLNAAVSMSMSSGREKLGKPRIYEVELTINPYRLTYHENEDMAVLWRATFVENKHPELKAVWTDDLLYTQALGKLGYDSVVYSNTYDDDGNDSYEIFLPTSARIIKVIAEGPKQIKALQRKMGWED